MSRYPASVWRPVPYTGLHARQPHRALILHTNGGGAQLYGWWCGFAQRGEHIGAQYQVFNDGKVECYVDPNLVVYHAYGASEWAIGVETEDDSDPNKPWTLPQIQSLAKIAVYHGVPAQMLASALPGDGIGYHQMHPEWNRTAHNCPGSVRVKQIPQVLAAMRSLTLPTGGGGRIPGATVIVPPPAPAPVAYHWTQLPLRVGSRGTDVKHLQSRLRITADGIFGPATERAVKAFQSTHHLTADGICGPLTAKAIG